MSEITLKNTASLIKKLAALENSKGIHVIWHGGEPLTVPLEWYRKANEIIDDEIGWENYTESMQTSLIPYTERWNDLIHDRLDGHLGSSIDFGHRTIKGSVQQYIDLWISKVELARSHGITVTPCLVPGRGQIGKEKEVLGFLMEHKFERVVIERYTNYGINTLEFPTNLEHSKFLISLFDETMKLVKKGGKPPKINVLIAGMMGVLFSKPGDRWGTSCQRNFLVVEPDGSTNTCPDRTSYDKPFSNTNDGLDSFTTSEQRRSWIRVMDITHKKDHCHSCEFNSWCKSGCPITPNGPSENQKECSGYKTFLLHLKSFLAEEANIMTAKKYIEA